MSIIEPLTLISLGFLKIVFSGGTKEIFISSDRLEEFKGNFQIIKSHKKQGFTPSLERTVLEKPQGGGGGSNWPPNLFRVKIAFTQMYFWLENQHYWEKIMKYKKPTDSINDKEEVLLLKEKIKLLRSENSLSKSDITTKQKVIDSILEHNPNLLYHKCCWVSQNVNNDRHQKSSEKKNK